MIILDTHIWIWWVDGDLELSQSCYDFISEHEADGLGVCAISCWETAKLVELGRLPLPLPVGEWLAKALAYPGILLLPLLPDVAVESTQLPGTFHRDPADQIIVATARLYREKSHSCLGLCPTAFRILRDCRAAVAAFL